MGEAYEEEVGPDQDHTSVSGGQRERQPWPQAVVWRASAWPRARKWGSCAFVRRWGWTKLCEEMALMRTGCCGCCCPSDFGHPAQAQPLPQDVLSRTHSKCRSRALQTLGCTRRSCRRGPLGWSTACTPSTSEPAGCAVLFGFGCCRRLHRELCWCGAEGPGGWSTACTPIASDPRPPGLGCQLAGLGSHVAPNHHSTHWSCPCALTPDVLAPLQAPHGHPRPRGRQRGQRAR